MFVPREKKYVRIVGLFLSVVILLAPTFAHASFFSFVRSLFGIGSSLDSGLIAYWTFDGKNMVSNVANSISGSNNGALILSTSGNTSTTTAIGAVGQALVFDGTNDYVSAGVLSGLGGTTKLTVSAWVNTNTLTGGDSSRREVISQSNTFSSTTFILRLNTASDMMEFLVGGTAAYSGTADTDTNSITANTWYHVVGVYDGANVTMYLNGVAKTPVARTVVVGNETAQVHIGNAWRGGIDDRFWSGAIDDIRVYSRALSVDEIKRLYLMGSSGVKVATTPGKGPVTASGATGLAGHWTFDGKTMYTNVSDSSGNAKNGMLILGATGNTSTTTTPGILGQALSFDGTNDYVQIASPAMPTGDFTISTWANVRTFSSAPTILMIADGSGGNEIWFGFNSSTRTPGFNLNDGAVVYGSTGVATSTWNHVVLRRSGSNVRIFLNGVSISSTTNGGTLNFSTCALLIGVDSDQTCTNVLGNYMDGSIDDVRVYSRALSDEEINRLYIAGASGLKVSTTGGSGSSIGDGGSSGLVGHWTFDGKNMVTNVADSSGAGNNGNLILGATGNTATTSIIGRLGQALSFDGVSDYVSIGDVNALDGISALTLSAWVRADALADYKDIIAKQTSATSRIMLITGGSLDVGNDDIICGVANGADRYGATDTGVFSANTWYHIVCVFDGTQTGDANRLKLYLNGVQQSSLTFPGAMPATTPSNTASLNIGLNAGSNYWKGAIDDVRVYTRALSAEEIRRLYTLGR